MRHLRAVVAVFAIALVAAPAFAQGGPGGLRTAPGEAASERPNPLQDVAFEQKLDAQVPPDLMFRDDTGRSVQLGDYFGKRPIVLALVYFECPMLCTQVLNGMVASLGLLRLDAGKDFDVLAVSFNHREGPELAAAKKQAIVGRYDREGTENGFHFLTGPEASILQLTRAVGFHFKWDEPTQQYAHTAGLIVLTPDGRVSKYFYGIEYSARDLRLGLVDASAQRIGSPVDQVLLYCFHYDPSTGKYSVLTMTLVRIGGVLTMLGLGAFWLITWLRGRHAPKLAEAGRRV